MYGYGIYASYVARKSNEYDIQLRYIKVCQEVILWKKKKNVTVHNEKVEYEWDGPIIYPSRRELTEEEKGSVEERHKKLGIED